ncbi:MAG: GNAT family N-acetyltransferase [Prevotellaceae bacterium]|jgi:ribosomal protein S18 acetylase RimI-like enzyme|nr:GNAT family N-acetyltransferase [Prevotellaceae bacterium]
MNSDIFLAKNLYEQTFPPDERRNFDDLLKIAKTKSAFCTEILKKENEFLGFIFYWNFADFVYIEHFAVEERFRNQGFGKEIMQNLCKKTVLPIILEVEKPDNKISSRRIGFYENLGFKVAEIPYLQPAYSPDKNPVPMFLMHRGQLCLKKCVETIRREVYQKF